MNRRGVILALALIAGALGWGSDAQARSGAPAPQLSDAAKAAITGQLNLAVARGDTPGLVALVVDQNGELYSAVSGKLDTTSAPMRPDAIFSIASMTKPVTSVAVMMLLEQSKLSLDDPVSKYLPGFDHLQVITKFNEADGTVETRPAKRVMTLRHLLTHTSGIGYGFSSPIVARLQQGNQKMEWELPLLHEPGEKWTYGASTRVLGMIVEKITGTSLEEYYQAHIFEPLGMTDTSFAVPAEKRSRLAAAAQRVDGKLQERPSPNPIPSTPTPPYRGDGGLYSTAHDYGLFMRMLLNGGHLGTARILSEHSVQIMGQNQIGTVFVSEQPVGIAALTKPFPLGAGHDKFGLGFQLAAAGESAQKYRSAGSMSWAGLFNTEFWIDPKLHVGGVLLMQYLPFYDDGAIRTLQKFEETVYRGLR